MYYRINYGYTYFNTREEAQAKIKDFEHVQDCLRGSHDEYVTHVVKEESDNTTTINVNFFDDEGTEFYATTEFKDLPRDEEEGITEVDVFKVHKSEDDKPYIDCNEDVVSSYDAYYSRYNYVDIERLESWFRELLKTEFGEVEFDGRFELGVEFERKGN